MKVLIAGGGPVGLFAGCMPQAYKIPFKII